MVHRKKIARVNMWHLNDVDRLFERMYAMAPPFTTESARHWVPNADVYETPEEVVIKADLAGVAREAIKVTLDGETVVISGVREENPEENAEYYHQVEIEYGAFRRVFHIPCAVDGDRARAVYRDGFLFVIIPKAARPVTIHTVIEIF